MIYGVKKSLKIKDMYVVTNSEGKGFTTEMQEEDARKMANRMNGIKRVKGWRDLSIKSSVSPFV